MFSITTPLMVVVPISIPITFINIVLQYKNKFPIMPISLPFLFRQAYGNHIFKVLYTFLLHKALKYYPLALHSC